MQVTKWGNDLAVRLPEELVRQLSLKEGDELDIHIVGANSVALVPKPVDREEIINKLRALRGSLPTDFRFDRDEANAR